MAKETIMVDGVRYYADRPRSCRGCFFRKKRKVGCTLKKENCCYLAESPKPTSPYPILLKTFKMRKKTVFLLNFFRAWNIIKS